MQKQKMTLWSIWAWPWSRQSCCICFQKPFHIFFKFFQLRPHLKQCFCFLGVCCQLLLLAQCFLHNYYKHWARQVEAIIAILQTFCENCNITATLPFLSIHGSWTCKDQGWTLHYSSRNIRRYTWIQKVINVIPHPKKVTINEWNFYYNFHLILALKYAWTMDLILLYQTSDSECIIQSELFTRIKKIIESSLIGISKKEY